MKPVRVASVQARPQSKTWEDLVDGADVGHALDLVDRAGHVADIVCLPELYPSAGEAQLRLKARELGVYLICGLREPGDGGVYNTATLIGPDGTVVGRQRKLFPTRVEVDRGTVPGDGYRVFATPLGKIGMIVCADLPFSRRGITELKRQGADMIFNPSWWFALGEAYPATIIARHLEYSLPIFGVDIARYALATAENGGTTLFPAAGGYTTATIPPPCKTLDELGNWFKTKPSGINTMRDFVATLGEEEDILFSSVDVDAVRAFPGYYFSDDAPALGASEIAGR